MPHNLHSTVFGFFHQSKHDSTAQSNSSKVAKNLLCVARRRANFQTRSIGASCGLYGGKNSRANTLRYLRNRGASNMAWWYRALSSTMTMRLPRARCRNSFFRNVSNVRASNFSHIERTNLPVLKLTAPKQATDLRVGAWDSTGSLTSGGTHIRHRVPCCWKWHSSRLHNSMSARFASRRSFFKSRDPLRTGLCNLGSGFAQPETHLSKDALALPHPKLHPIALPQVLGKQFAIPQMRGMAKFLGGAPHVSPQRCPLFGVKRGGATRTFTLAQTIQAIFLESLDPALHR